MEEIAKGSEKNSAVKLILIGNGDVGKTQIAKRLEQQEQFVFNTQHDSTQAIVLLQKKIGDFEVQIWDFAGQDIYHATHRLFMQTRALIVLVWDYENENKPYHEWKGKLYDNETIEYWLEYARCFAPQNPILVVQNKIDYDSTSLYQERKVELKKEYNIQDFIELSAKSGIGFQLLDDCLEDILNEHQAFKTPDLPTAWVAVRQEIRTMQLSTQKLLSLDEFITICQNKQCATTDTLLAYLHDTGVFYYRSGYFQNQIILDQEWAIKAVYKILDRQSDYFEILQYEKGKLSYDIICSIWAKNTDQERALFIDFMLSADLAFEATENKKHERLQDRSFVLPQLLPSEKDSDIITWGYLHKNDLNIEHEISYDFLPKVFVQRFIVKAQRLSSLPLMWQNGIIIESDAGKAIVEAIYGKDKSRIIIRASQQFLVDKIVEELNDISQESRTKPQNYPEKSRKFGLEAVNPEKSMKDDLIPIQPTYEGIDSTKEDKQNIANVNIYNAPVTIYSQQNITFNLLHQTYKTFNEIRNSSIIDEKDNAALEKRIDELLAALDKAVQSQDYQQYIDQVENWFEPNRHVDEQTVGYLAKALFYYENQKKTDLKDYGAIVLCLGKAVELEVKMRIGDLLTKNNLESYNFDEEKFTKITKLIEGKTPFNFGFAHNYFRELKEAAREAWVNDLFGNIFEDPKAFFEDKDEKILKLLEKLPKTRNFAAHPQKDSRSDIDKGKAEEYRDKVKAFITHWNGCLKQA